MKTSTYYHKLKEFREALLSGRFRGDRREVWGPERKGHRSKSKGIGVSSPPGEYYL